MLGRPGPLLTRSATREQVAYRRATHLCHMHEEQALGSLRTGTGADTGAGAAGSGAAAVR